jgi:myo-inositol-1(or 4)-monophosphatase
MTTPVPDASTPPASAPMPGDPWPGAMAAGEERAGDEARAALLDELLELALIVAAAAATLVHEGRPAIVEVADTKSSGTDVVTEMDRASERLLVERILAARPDDGILGEEGSDRATRSGVRWVIDPIDGTVNYLYGLPGWAVSVGVEVDGAPTVGVVVVPSQGEVYFAVRGRGAFLRDHAGSRRLGVNDPVALDRALIGTGFGYRVERRIQQATVVREVIPVVRDIRRAGACATDLCAVAAGRLDGYFELGPQAWDHVAGGVIAQEAGASFRLVALPGESDALVIAAGPALFQPLTDLVVPLH